MMASLATPLSWIEISHSAISHNLNELRQLVGPEVQIFACIKANAYGHGLAPIEKLLGDIGIDGFAVTDFEEADYLRQQGITQPIQVMSPLPDHHVCAAAAAGLWVWVHDLDDVRRIEQALCAATKQLQVVVKVDTGMGRLGVTQSELAQLLTYLQASSRLNLVSVATHFATADIGDDLFAQQKATFAWVKQLTTHLLGQRKIHFQCANSAAILRDPATHDDIVRPGLALYGYWPDATMAHLPQNQAISLRPALAWKTRLVQIKTLAAGANVGYGGRTQTPKTTKLGILPVGYAHGVGYRLSNRGHVLVHGHRVPILGNDCMNLTMIDLSDIAEAQVGDEVVLIGQQGTTTQTAADLAQVMGTLVYEVLVNLSPLLARTITT